MLTRFLLQLLNQQLFVFADSTSFSVIRNYNATNQYEDWKLVISENKFDFANASKLCRNKYKGFLSVVSNQQKLRKINAKLKASNCKFSL